jgi:hypothetical protein
MRVGTYKGKEILLSDEQWNRLRRRFDPKNIVKHEAIEGHCVEEKCICDTIPRYPLYEYPDCKQCPLSFDPESYAPCVKVARDIMETSSVRFYHSRLTLSTNSTEEAKEVVSRMSEFLKSFKRRR